ncbi:MAG: hypothetical protein FWG99_00470 [Treponema sp.]|nr:hypothetical protein [Treponema sp.]
MKNFYFDKITAAVLTVILAVGMLPVNGFTQAFPAPSPSSKTSDSLYDVRGFDRTVFDYHFSRADRELSPDRWLAEAKQGINMAICAWELFASSLYDNPFLLQGARAKIEKWSGEELEERFSEWLAGRFFGEAVENAMTGISGLLGDTQKQYTWHLDTAGNIILEDKTGDPLVIRPHESAFIFDLEKWKNDAANHINSESAFFNDALTALYPELLAYMPAELRQSMNSVILGTGSTLKNFVKREFENIAAREERLFISRRTRDVWSLRNKSDEEAARIVTERLISEAEEVCIRGINDLNTKIEEASAGTGDLAFLGEEWLRMYQEQFDRGLRAWEDAEERFFIRRIEWEQESLRLFSEGEDVWLAAYHQLEEERRKWELKAKELFESGEALFMNISENLEKAITAARAEFEYNMAMRIGSGAAKAKALVDMYLTSGSAALTIRDNILFWQKQIAYGDPPDPSEARFSQWLAGERLNFWIKAETNEKRWIGYDDYVEQLEALNYIIITTRDPAEKAFATVNYNNLYNRFIAAQIYLIQIQDIIEDIVAGKTVTDAEFEFAEGNGSLGLFDRARFNNISEITKLYELYLSYMARATETREIIIEDFSELMGTGALKDIISPNASSEDFCLDEYQLELIRAKALVLYWERKTYIAEAVSAYAKDLSAGRVTEAEGIQAWENAKTAYNESLERYETELNLLAEAGEDMKNMQKKLDSLNAELKYAEEKLNKMNSDYSAIIAASITDREDQLRLELDAKYNFLVTEYRLLSPNGGASVYSAALNYGMNMERAWRIENAQIALFDLVNGKNEGVGVDALSLYELKERVLAGLESEVSLRIRLAGINLFSDTFDGYLRSPNSSYSSADWYSGVKGIAHTYELARSLYGEKLGEQLIADYKNSYSILIETRLALEIDALDFFLYGDSEPESISELLSESCLVDDITAAELLEVLIAFRDRLNHGEGFYSYNDDENEIIYRFISGESSFTGTENIVAELINEFNFSLGLLELYSEYALFGSFTAWELWQNTLVSLERFFSEYGLALNGEYLPDADRICAKIFGQSGNFLNNAAEFLRNFEQCFLFVPEWLEYELDIWKTYLIDYIAAYAVYLGRQPLEHSSYFESELDNMEGRYNLFYENINSMRYIDDLSMDKIEYDYLTLKNENILLAYKYQIAVVLEKISKESDNAGYEKHWRRFLSGFYINSIDSAASGVSSWNEGVMLDALEKAVFSTGRMNIALAMYSQINNDIVTANSEILYGLYHNENLKIEHGFSSLDFQRTELARLGRAYDYSKIPSIDLTVEAEKHYEALGIQENIFYALWDDYLAEAEEFVKIGSLYDNQYGRLKYAYNNTERLRFEYEKQDAIRRWASTAYLDAGNIDLLNSKDRLARAQMVLTVLSDIYDNEERRQYDNPEYQALYLNYEQWFNNKLVIAKTYDALQSLIGEEAIKNNDIYSQYNSVLATLGQWTFQHDYDGYNSSADQSQWSVKDIITVKNGQLAFSRDEMTLTGVNDSKSKLLNDYFTSSYVVSGEKHIVSQFEESVRSLSQRMTGYFMNAEKFNQWGLARDYLISSMIAANGNLKFLSGYYTGAGELADGGSLGRLSFKYSPVDRTETVRSAAHNNSSFYNSLRNPQAMLKNAWEGLSEQEKADLEFYIILTLSGRFNNYAGGFSMIHTLDVYQKGYNFVREYYKKADKICNDPLKLGGLGIWKEMRDINKTTMNRINTVLNETKKIVETWKLGLAENLRQISLYASEYTRSCAELDEIEKTQPDGQRIVWQDIEDSVSCLKTISDYEITILESCWKKMLVETGRAYTSVPAAIADLLGWAGNTEVLSRQALEYFWIADEQSRKKAEIDFRLAQEAYFSDEISIDTLEAAAENAYGKNSAAWKNHLENLGNTMIRDLGSYLNSHSSYYTEFQALGEDLVAVVARTLHSRYAAELAGRDNEWNLQRMDIAEKYIEWQMLAKRLVENGRNDWDNGVQKITEAHRQWNENFVNEYNRVSAEWTETYLAGLEDKKKWLEMVGNAADNAASSAFLSLVGAEAERMARSIETREPFGLRDIEVDADDLLAELLNSSGIRNMTSAFASINAISETGSIAVRRGIGGLSSWDASLARAAAGDLARKTNSQLAAQESAKLALVTRNIAEEAVKNLVSSVDSANNDFRESMDDTFIFKGLWRRSGNNYVKDIIMGSTLFEPVITERKTIAGYSDYRMDPVELKVNLDEKYLASLDTLALRSIMESVYQELESIAKEIFGNNSGPEKIIKQGIIYKRSGNTRESMYEEVLIDLEERDLFPGKFGAHIGYRPAVKPGDLNGNNKNTMFHDQGSGELGRLMTQFIYWAVIDGKGSAEIYTATWEKRMWDDSGSSFEAPSLRTALQIAGTVAAAVVSIVAAPFTAGASTLGLVGLMALNVGITSTSELVFNALDVGYGHKTFGEAGFSFGKTTLINTVSSVGSGVFGGVGNAGFIAGQGLTSAAVGTAAGSAAATVAVQTTMAGVQTFTTGLLTNAIGGINYSREGGWSYSVQSDSGKGLLINTLSSMGGAFTTGAFQAINTGTVGEKVVGFSGLNREDIARLNGLAGSLAGEGINFAFGGDFTLNLLNIGLFTDSKYNSGLLELHIGRDGSPTMNLGTGGANISPENILAAFRGAQVWNMNNQIGRYGRDNDFDALIALRAQYGFGDSTQVEQLRNILNKIDELWTESGQGYDAKTEMIDGVRVVRLGNYQAGMSVEEQMRLAAILGHEAYRDGIISPDDFAELKDASIARILMGDRINQDYQWFYAYNVDFGFESFLYGMAELSGYFELLDNYLQYTYKNEEDFFWQWASTGGNFQSMDELKSIPLLNSMSVAKVDEINDERLDTAFDKYKEDLAKEEDYTGDIADFVSEKGTDDVLKEAFKNDAGLLSKYEYDPIQIESIYSDGCMFMSTKYGLEAITGKQFDTLWFNEYIKNNNLYDGESDLSKYLMAEIMNRLAGNQYNVTLVQTGLPDAARLFEYGQAGDMYLAHLRIKENGTGGGYHSVMVSGIEYTYDIMGNVTGISAVNVANPWGKGSFTGKTSYTMDQIARWDIFRVTQQGPLTTVIRVPSFRDKLQSGYYYTLPF